MVDLPKGKGLFIWQGQTCGPVEEVLDLAQDLGLGWLAPRLAWTVYPDQYASYPWAELKRLVSGAHAKGLQVWGWHYVDGGIRVNVKTGQRFTGYEDPREEAAVAIAGVNEVGFDGLIVDAEIEYKELGVGSTTYKRAEAARNYGSALRSKLGWSYPVALCSYRFPHYHMEFPWSAFLEFCNLHMPQVYWGDWSLGAGATETANSNKELQALKRLPFVPVGRAYIGDGHPGGTSLVGQVANFLTFAKEQYPACAFWSLDALRTHVTGRELLKTMGGFAWAPPGPVEPPPPPEPPKPARTVEERLNHLEGAVDALEGQARSRGWAV
jgi:hypothetical protein